MKERTKEQKTTWRERKTKAPPKTGWTNILIAQIHTMRIELTRVGLLIYLANHYTTRGVDQYTYCSNSNNRNNCPANHKNCKNCGKKRTFRQVVQNKTKKGYHEEYETNAILKENIQGGTIKLSP